MSSAIRQPSATCTSTTLTARESIEDRVRGLDVGANDYLVKPFALSNLEELGY